MEQLLKDQKLSSKNQSQQFLKDPFYPLSMPLSSSNSSKQAKMNIIDSDDVQIENLQHSIDIKEKALRNSKNKSSATIMNEMQNSIRKIESRINDENQEGINKMKARIKQLTEEKKRAVQLATTHKKEIERLNQELHEFEQKLDEIQTLNQNLSDEIESLQKQNDELVKKNLKCKKELELIPELKTQLATMKDTLEIVASEIEEQKFKSNQAQHFQSLLEQEYSSTMSKAQESMGALNQYQKKIEGYEAKNYDLIKENLDLKEQINLLKEEKIKITHRLETSESEIKSITSDLIYIYSKLKNSTDNVFESQQNQHSEMLLQTKFLISEIERRSEELIMVVRDEKLQSQIFEERLGGLKDQNACLQKIIDKNQELIIEQQNKISQGEDFNKNLKLQIEQQRDQDKTIEKFKIMIQNQLLNIKHQIETQQSQERQSLSNDSSKGQNSSIEKLLDFISEKAQRLISNEKLMSAKLKELSQENQALTNQITQKMKVLEEKKQQFQKEDLETRAQYQNRIQQLKEELEKNQYDYSYHKIDAEAKIKGKEIQIQDIQKQSQLIQEMLNFTLQRTSQLQFEKKYLSKKLQRIQDKVTQLDTGIRSLIPPSIVQEEKQLVKSTKILKRTAIQIIFMMRLKKQSKLQRDKYSFKAFSCFWQNYFHDRRAWDASLMQNQPMFTYLQDLFSKLVTSSKSLRDPLFRSIVFSQHPPMIEKVRNYLNQFHNSCLKLEMKLRDKEDQVSLMSQKILLYEDETLRQYESNERLSSQLNLYQKIDHQELMQENKKITQVNKELQEKLNDQEMVFLQKINYLKRDIELKNHQLESLKSLIQVKDREIQRQKNESQYNQPNQKKQNQIIILKQQQQQDVNEDRFIVKGNSRQPVNGLEQQKDTNDFNYSFSGNI